MALHLHPEEEILPVYLSMEITLKDTEKELVYKFRNDFRTILIGKVNLSVFIHENGAESYHKSLNQ